jgi:uncharacterized protein GlcG (DUF336 family)
MQLIEELGEKEAGIATTAIREELAKRGKVAVIAVSDSRGELISLLRMDGKAYKENGWQMANSDQGYTGWDGGVPVLSKGQVVGAIAVSGLAQEEDAELARLGASRIAESIGD